MLTLLRGPYFWYFMCAAVALLAAMLIAKFVRNKVHLSAGRKALEEGRIADALRSYQKAATVTLIDYNTGMFREAMRGITTTYQRAGRAVDLQPLLMLHQQMQVLRKRDVRQPGGLKVMDKEVIKAAGKLKRQFEAEMQRLPRL